MDMKPNAMTNALETHDLVKSYGPVEVLKNINVSMGAGEFLVLVGPSGCGKSTLLNCIAGLEEITAGTLQINGHDVTNVPPRDRDIAMVFQSYALYPTMTVAENIGFGMKVRRMDRAVIAQKVGDVARLLQIDHLLDRKPSQLSGGQRQRVAMGRALVRDPALFLFDEPLSNLDAKLRVEMRAEIKRLHQTTGASIVYVTHDQIEAMTLATKIVVLKDGYVQQIGTPEEIYDRPANTFVADFMGSPPMNLVEASVLANGTLDFGAGQHMHAPQVSDFVNTGDKVVVGFRPEDMNMVQQGAGQMDVTVTMVEMTGADSYVSFQLGNKTVTARTPGRYAGAEGSLAGLALDMGKLCFFDAGSTERLG
jgi:multiple sugar transport system ATP-binding protein